ncbi:MAG: hypothetical protein ACJ79H_17920 [Myxococcales bacterium]
MRRGRAAALAAALLTGSAAAGAPIDFHGNVAILDSVYRTVLALPDSAPATRETARQVEEKLTSFLHQSGYDLAVVRARAAAGSIEVEIEEGTLDKVIVLGTDLVTCLRMRLDLSMAGRVYNRPELESRLRELRGKFDVDEVSYEVVPIAGPQQDRPTLVAMSELRPLGIADAPRRYELRVRIGESGWATGVTPSVELTSLEGAALGAEVHAGGLAPGARSLFLARAAAGSRSYLETEGSRFTLSSADLFAAWFAPPVTGELRPAIGVRATLLDRQRADLGLEGFHSATLQAGAFFEDAVSPNLSLWMGGGVERRLLLSVQRGPAATSPAVDATPRAQTRPYGAVRFRYRFDPEHLRRDRGDYFQFDGRVALPGGAGRDGSAYLRALFQHVRVIGWDEFWIQGFANFLGGDIFFTEEESLGADALRGAFSGTDYTRRLLAAGFEYRYSLWRDVFKLGVFTNLALYQPIEPFTDRGRGARFAASAGPGLHMLVEDTVSFDAYLSVGVDALGRTSIGAQLGLHQAF